MSKRKERKKVETVKERLKCKKLFSGIYEGINAHNETFLKIYP